MLSFICVAESDMLQGIGPGEENAVRPFDWADYERPGLCGEARSGQFGVQHIPYLDA